MSSASRTASSPNTGTSSRTRRRRTSPSAACRCSAIASPPDLCSPASKDTPMKLTGNTIFITGGGSGIGRGLAEALHRLGNEVIISGRRRDRINTVISANPGMKAIELDITDPASIERAAERLVGEYPDLNVLINNAGIMEFDRAAGPLDD